ncbi:hypothetical protein A9Q84_09000 [Halobacteriovorax marinus]|uniref:GAF domain-containing protein n=1 Tax=Halobacteriovorax marinus TaxID=97084 RepID=A0A1Y5F6E5_9BACT|nr:hypothetical protein A9Q84_09000 [Halobacteriovorax marinus]
MKNLELIREVFLFPQFQNHSGIEIYYKNINEYSLVFNTGEVSTENRSLLSIAFEGEEVGKITFNSSSIESEKIISETAAHLSPLFRSSHIESEFTYNLSVLEWLKGARELIPDIADWIGVYFKTDYLTGEKSSDLVLGPFFGESTNHVRIPIEKGLCGLALREERVVNVEDVHADDRHIACSLKTNSELIIPLCDKRGEFVAELDIDSNQRAAFSKDIEEKMKLYCESFPLK